MRTVRAWWVLAVIALLAFAGAIRLLVLRLGGRRGQRSGAGQVGSRPGRGAAGP